MASTAPLAIYGGSTKEESICFGSMTLRPHSPTMRPAFESLSDGWEITFGSLRYYFNRWGSVLLSDPISTASEPVVQG